MLSRRVPVALVILLLLGGVLLAMWSARRDERPDHAAGRDPGVETPGREMTGQDVSFTVTEGEVKKWRLNAASAVYNEDRTEARLHGVRGEFFDAKGASVMQFTAPEGEWAQGNNHVRLKGGVVATATPQDGDQKAGEKAGGKGAGELRAPEMRWDAKAGEVLATGGVTLRHAQGTSSAQTCRFDLNFSRIALQGNVISTVTSP